MKTILVSSNNPVKLQAALVGFQRMFPGETFEVRGLSTPSGVSAQPMTSAETLQGAFNRASNVRALVPEADYWVGIEGGCEPFSESELTVFAWVVILSQDKTGKGQTGVFFLPARVAELVHQGIELGEADDIVFGRINSKQGNGAVGLLTADLIDRAAYYEHAVILALIPFRNPNLY